MKPKVFVTGANGMDGSYLVELLLAKGYEVHGLIRRASTINTERIDHLTLDKDVHLKTLFLYYGDLTDGTNITGLMHKIQPDLIFNTAAMSHVAISFEVPEYSANTDGLGAIRLLESMRLICPHARFLQCSTSELYGDTIESPQDENTPFRPRSPYAAAKLFAYWCVRNYRDAYGLFASNSICFNHEAVRRSHNFVTRKISFSVARIKHGLQSVLRLGNLAAMRDWGYAPEYVEGMYQILQHREPDDFVLATGETHSVEEFCIKAFDYAGIPLEFDGEGIYRKGYDQDGIIRVEVDPQYFRPTDVEYLLGNASKAQRILGWKPTVKFDQLVEIMVKHDIDLIKRMGNS